MNSFNPENSKQLQSEALEHMQITGSLLRELAKRATTEIPLIDGVSAEAMFLNNQIDAKNAEEARQSNLRRDRHVNEQLNLFLDELPNANMSMKGLSRAVEQRSCSFYLQSESDSRLVDATTLWVSPGARNDAPKGQMWRGPDLTYCDAEWLPVHVIGQKVGKQNKSNTDAELDLLLAPAYKFEASNKRATELMIARTSLRAYEMLGAMSVEELCHPRSPESYMNMRQSKLYESSATTSIRKLHSGRIRSLWTNTLPKQKLDKDGTLSPTTEAKLRNDILKSGVTGALSWNEPSVRFGNITAFPYVKRPIEEPMASQEAIEAFSVREYTQMLATTFNVEQAYDKTIGSLNLDNKHNT